ncbi:MAG TPA: zinc ribbon domain-containing protein [Chthonomonas sp.]|uniref:zinc ribbon domain-containing protein n=1 Tax=Chthonomonas sp. TaxID=2282153 RepID=UPI002B4B433E|nr:zinc ribbon domain-containing protein [Chthonomonas sp.]HLI48295.1 zinc ribbon domain-containing protein [Chthonomonas sp.]
MRCQQCGQEIEASASTCPYCGATLQVSPPTAGTPQPRTQPSSESAMPNPAAMYPTTYAVERCLVCGATLPPRNFACPQCHTPRGMVVDPDDPTCTRYLVVVPSFMASRVATSRLDTSVLAGWHWGAAFLTLFWAWSHRLRAHVVTSVVFNALFLIALGCAVGLRSNSAAEDMLAVFFTLWVLLWFGFRLYYGFCGMQIARQSGRYNDPETFLDVQKKWQRAGLWAVIGYLVLFIIGLALLNTLS